jgi:S-adenosylmethionine hydrolase
MALKPDNIHPLLQDPAEISIAYGKQLEAAHKAHITGLSEYFTATGRQVSPAFTVTVYYYSDNGGRLDDSAPKEIKSALNDFASIVQALTSIKQPKIEYDNTPAQAWVQGSFDLAQTTRFSRVGVGNVTFLNCAPRLDERGQNGNNTNKGEPIYVAMLPNGHIISANSRYNFTFFRDMVESGALEIFEANVQPDGTQFRSRDIFPLHAVVLANQATQNIEDWKPEMSLEERRAFLAKIGIVDTEKKLELADIPQLKRFTVAHIDVHGNVKTNTRLSDLTSGELDVLKARPFQIQVGDKLLTARLTERMFDRKDGEAGLSKGSSGHDWIGAAAKDGFLEVSIIGGDAAEALGVDPSGFRNPIEISIPALLEAAADDHEPDPLRAFPPPAAYAGQNGQALTGGLNTANPAGHA